MRKQTENTAPLLEVRNLRAWYGRVPVLFGVSLHIARGEIVGLFGHNGAGKTSLVKSILGVQLRREGSVLLEGREIVRLPADDIASLGVGVVPQGEGVFGGLRVRENLGLGVGRRRQLGEISFLGEVGVEVRERWSDWARELSGGQRQMVSIARAVLGNGSLIILDEPSVGLSPQRVVSVMSAVSRLREEGLTILLVEQNLEAALQVIDRGYVIRNGGIVFEGTRDELSDRGNLLRYF